MTMQKYNKFHKVGTSVMHGCDIKYVLPKAHASTFKQLNEDYGIDAEKVFFGGFLMKDVDAVTFQALNAIYSKDSKQVFYLRFPIKKADASSFVALNESFAKDKNNIFYCQSLMEKTDLNSFRVLRDSYAIDKNNAYYCETIIAKADVATFTTLSSQFSRDKSNFWRYKTLIPKLNPNDIILIGGDWVNFNGHIHNLQDLTEGSKLTDHINEKNCLKNIDANSASMITNYCYKDKHGVYNNYGEEIEDADIDSFEHVEGDWYRDKNKLYYDYYGFEVVENANPKTFVALTEVLGTDISKAIYREKRSKREGSGEIEILANPKYWRNALGVYHGNQYVHREIDATSFKFLNAYFMADKNSVYSSDGDKKLEGVASKNFTVIDGPWAKDGKTVYYKDKLLLDADSDTFTVQSEKLAKDKNNLYVEDRVKPGGTKMLDLNIIEAFRSELSAGYSFRESFVIEITDKVARFLLPSGAPGPDFDFDRYHRYFYSANAVRLLLEETGGKLDISNSSIEFTVDSKKMETTLAEIGKSLGYPSSQVVWRKGKSSILWIGFDNEIDGELSTDLEWEFEEKRMINHLVRLLVTYQGPQNKVINQRKPSKLKNLVLYDHEFITAYINETEKTGDVPIATDITSGKVELYLSEGKDFSNEEGGGLWHRRLAYYKLLYRVAAKVEMAKELQPIKAKKFRVTIASFDLRKDDRSLPKKIEKLAIENLTMPIEKYLLLEV